MGLEWAKSNTWTGARSQLAISQSSPSVINVDYDDLQGPSSQPAPQALASSDPMKGLGAQSSIGALCGISMGILFLHPNFLDVYHFYSKVPKCVCWLSIGFALRPESFVCEGKLRNLPLTSISTSPNKRSPKINQVNKNIISLNKGLGQTNKLKKTTYKL